MKCYIVGGAVRDRLLGLPVADRDWVVVGATPEMMQARGFRPVGKDFPVFLHPQTQEEYALARTERKSGRGYHGFVFHTSPEVTLEEDLIRRDLTINAIAEDEHGQLTDPYGGQADLQARLLRHVSPAFAEDPVRILRLARFAARFDFAVAEETMQLMRDMVAVGEADALVAERVWQELAKGLMTARPSRMFTVLRDCGALARLLPELDALFGVPQRADYHPYTPQYGNYQNENNELDGDMQLFDSTSPLSDSTIAERVCWVLDYAAKCDFPLTARFALMLLNVGFWAPRPDSDHVVPNTNWKKVKEVSDRLKVPTECRDLAVLACRYHLEAHLSVELDAQLVVELLTHTDAFRRPKRFHEFLLVCEADARAHSEPGKQQYHQATLLRNCLAACQQIDTAAVASGALDKSHIPAEILAARVRAVADELSK
ncbi:multifunctional CCA tRNA nucleotidyl transferase/2'3'-cyclic phosphodiesterase/2'nucleotidase/phosphatase [Vogesella fluminis]|uniref:CCA-adding enzyme n=1 Tax=Vogesella fluminis TaxID=1069161 RepID=A0ABQ3H5G6_9NEIS|nr:multifunctional CCA tRNA nucleotidyl transferase/2'3'-cyclic phosphodiesterase/2'nucleotidase/phosphatase [Vogesella fluminis]GHD71382.1 multifunctional CCA protein [Vogesella fluminis]